MRRASLTVLGVLLLGGCGRSPAETAYAAARAALVAGDLARAEREAEIAVDEGGPRFARLQAFVRGNVAFARCEDEAEAAAMGDREAAKAALKHAEDALAFWQWAARSRRDWPAARRNVERALLKLASLRERRGDGKQKPPEPPKPTDGAEAKPEPKPELAVRDLPAGEVLGLFELLGRREREKIQLRRAQRATRRDGVERDW